MLHLHFAPSSDVLAPILLTHMRTVWKDPFAPPAVIVPNPAVGKWLQLRLADCPVESQGGPLGFGCVANLEMQTLERFLWRALRPSENMRLLDVAVAHQALCALLDDTLLADPRYAPVRAYLKESDRAIDPIKKVHLASKLARLFQEYEFNRPSVWDASANTWRGNGIDACWLEQKRYHAFNDHRDMTDINESWQMDLYLKAHECLQRGFIDAPGARILPISLPHLHRLRRSIGMENGAPWTVPPSTIFLFQVSKISHFHRNTLVEISQMDGVDMHVFLINPCAEFWEDVDTWRNRRYPRAWKHDSSPRDAGVPSRKPEDYGKSELEDFTRLPEDPALLEQWGRAGKENIYLWCPRAEWNFEYVRPAWVEQEKPPETLLKALQLALLRRENNLPAPAPEYGDTWKNDGSLQVLACPDPTREVEELREQILDIVEADTIRRLNEIVVYLPDPSAYVSQIHRVFDAFPPGSPGHIPYSILGAPGGDSLFAQGVSILLDILNGLFDRAHVFSLLQNPIVQSTRTFSPENVAIWEGWAEKLGIFRGFNRRHRERMGDKGQTITDAHTFEPGLARLLIANLAAGPVRLKFRLPAEHDGLFASIPAFRDFESSDADCVEEFCSLVERLYEDTRALNESLAEAPLSVTVEAMAELVWAWFGVIPDDRTGTMTAEERVRGEFLDALFAIKRQDDLALRKDRMGSKEFFAMVGESLPEELPGGSRAWTGGVTFAPLSPAMIVPHRAVFVLGLDAAAFPGSNDKTAWQLLSNKRIVGDSDKVRDNRYTFLELALAAQERLVLSFRARNMHKEEDMQPSSVVCELESYLKSQGLTSGPDDGRCLVRRAVPWIISESLPEIRETGGRARGSWDPAEMRRACIEGLPGITKALHRYGTAAPPPYRPGQGTVRADIYGMRRFFANPLEYHLSKTLGVEIDERPDTLGAADEPLQSGALEMSGLKKSIWTHLLLKVFTDNTKDACTHADTLREEAGKIAEQVYRAYIAGGGSPEAQFCSMEKDHVLSWARDCVNTTLELCGEFSDHMVKQHQDFSLGRKGFPNALNIDLGENRTCGIGCRHGLALVPRGASGTIGILQIKKDGNAKDNPDLWLTGVMQSLAEQALPGPEARQFVIRLVQLNRGNGDGKTGCTHATIKPGTTGAIMDWCVGLLKAMVIERSADHLPLEVIKDLTKQNRDKGLSMEERWAGVTRANIEDELSDELNGYACYLEAFKLVEARVPDKTDADLRELAKTRFAPFLEGWFHE